MENNSTAHGGASFCPSPSTTVCTAPAACRLKVRPLAADLRYRPTRAWHRIIAAQESQCLHWILLAHVPVGTSTGLPESNLSYHPLPHYSIAVSIPLVRTPLQQIQAYPFIPCGRSGVCAISLARPSDDTMTESGRPTRETPQAMAPAHDATVFHAAVLSHQSPRPLFPAGTSAPPPPFSGQNCFVRLGARVASFHRP